MADDENVWANLAALLVIVAFAALGGFLIKLIQGVTLPGGKVVPPICECFKTIIIPELVGMIVFGCIARNFFGDFVLKNYPPGWADWIRQMCLSIILMRGGLELSFEGKGLTVVTLTLCPQITEAVGAAVSSHYLVGLPWALAFAMGFCLGAVSPAVLVPSIMILHNKNYGTKKGIPVTMIAASSFDDIIAITVFSILVAVGFEQIGAGSEDGESMSTGEMLLSNLLQIAAGIIGGLLLGQALRFLNLFKTASSTTLMMTKCFLMVAVAIMTPLVCHWVHFHESKYIGIIFFGYSCFVSWGDAKPERELGVLWRFCGPFLFGTVGASVELNVIGDQKLGNLFIIILCGLSLRWVATYFATAQKKFSKKERAFMAFAWIPKATVQAAIGGAVLTEASQATGISEAVRKEYMQYGQVVMTCSVMAICLTAPLGAILINTLGVKWLPYDGDDGESQKGEQSVEVRLNKVQEGSELIQVEGSEKVNVAVVEEDQILHAGEKEEVQ